MSAASLTREGAAALDAKDELAFLRDAFALPEGVVYLDDLRPYLFDAALYPIITIGSVLHTELPTIDARETALSAIQKFESSGAWSLPVIEDGRFVGMMSKSTLFDRYRRELIVHTSE